MLTDTEFAAPTTDDTNNLVRLTYPDQTWASVVAGDSWAKLLTCTDYDTTTGTDTDTVLITAQDMLVNGAYVVPSGVNIRAVPSGPT